MPHLVILYTGQLDAEADISKLCRTLADTMLIVEDEQGKRVFPTGGVRVFAYPAPHYAVADGGAAGTVAGPPNGEADQAAIASMRLDPANYAFVYLNLRMGRGRSALAQQRAGEALAAAATTFFEPLMARRRIGVTLQIDEGREVFDAKHSNLHALFSPKA